MFFSVSPKYTKRAHDLFFFIFYIKNHKVTFSEHFQDQNVLVVFALILIKNENNLWFPLTHLVIF